MISSPSDGFQSHLRLNVMSRLARARILRRNPTEAERRLWYQLRKRGLADAKFSRQIGIGTYIVDFVCRELKLVIEVDGVTHGETHEIAYDEKRTAFLKSKGYRVLRVSNHAIFTELDGVMETIGLAIENLKAPPPAVGHLRPDGAEGSG